MINTMDWAWIVAFFPLWAVSAGTCFALVSGPKRTVGVARASFSTRRLWS